MNLLIICLSVFEANAQTYSEHSFCFTPTNIGNYLKTLPGFPDITGVEGAMTIRVYPHIIRDEFGYGGQIPDDVYISLENMKADFEEHDIFFEIECSDFIDYEGYDVSVSEVLHFGFDNNQQIAELTNVISHADGIDVFFLPKQLFGEFGGGKALGIPSKSLVIGGTWPFGELDVITQTHILTHEMGHCLGLFHTHHGTCVENGDDEACP